MGVEHDAKLMLEARGMSRRRLLRLVAGAAVAVPLVSLAAACGGGSSSTPAPTATSSTGGGAGATGTAAATGTPATGAGTPKQGGTLRTANAQSVADTLNQHISNFTGSRMAARHVLDCLVSIDTGNGEILPWLATKWELSPDGTEYTFDLRDDVTFHDGTKFDADAVVKNFEYTMAADTKRGWAYGALGGDKYDRTETIDPKTVKVVFKSPYIVFLPNLSDGGLGIDSPAAMDKHGDQYGMTALVGSGSFKFVEMVLNDRLVLERNPDYNWGPSTAKHQGPAHLDKLIYLDIKENATRAAALQNGDVNIARLVETLVKQFEGSKDVELVTIPKAGTTRMFLMNCERAPLDDINVRKAINMAVDKAALIKLPAWAGIGLPGIAPLPRNMVPNHDLSSLEKYDIPYDPDQAAKLLDEAGWKMGSNNIRTKDGKELVFEFVTMTDTIPQVEPLDGMLNKVGAKLNIKAGDFNVWIDSTNKREFDMTLMSDSGNNSAGMIEEFFYSKGPYADYLAPNAEIDAAIEKAVNALTLEDMWKDLFAAMELIMAEVPGVMAWEQMYIDGVRTGVNDVGYNESGYPFFYDTWLDNA